MHVWSGDVATFPFAPYDDVPVPATPYPVERLVADLDAAGVGSAVVIQPRLYGADHRYLDQALRRYPDRLSGVHLVDPLHPPAAARLSPSVHARRRLPRSPGRRLQPQEIKFGAMAAVGVVTAVPIILLAVVANRQIVAGLTRGAVKG